MIIKEQYPEAIVRMEYVPSFNLKMHIDILVILQDKWIPIELKYKTKGGTTIVNHEIFNLKKHGAKEVNCYLYLKDIERIESIRENVSNFKEEYTIFSTNDECYLKPPKNNNVVYYAFSLEKGVIRTGKLDWHQKTGAGTKRHYENPIILKDKYACDWKEYSKIDNSTSGTFHIIINKIKFLK